MMTFEQDDRPSVDNAGRKEPTHVLIVDDCDITREVLRSALPVDRFAIIEAEDGADALRILATKRVDFISSDINMPVMKGCAMIRCIRRNPQFDAIPIVVVSTDQAAMTEIVQLPNVHWLGKPIAAWAFQEAVTRMAR